MKIRRILSAPMVAILCVGLLIFALVFAIVTRPAPPEISVSHISATGQIRLDWEPVSGAGSYRVYRSAEGEEGPQLMLKTDSPGFTDDTAESGRIYCYYVRAVSSLFIPSGPSKEVRCARILPQPVIRLTGVDASGLTRIRWETVEGADHYRLYRSADGSSWELLKATRDTAYTDTQAQIGETIYYRLQAMASDPICNSAYSDIHNRTRCLPCPEVSLSNDPNTGALVLNWERVEDARDYEVFRAEGPAGSYHSITVTDDPFYADLEGAPQGHYRYCVKALSPLPEADSALSTEVAGIRDLARPQLDIGCEATTGNVTLSWEPVPGAVGYEIYWAEQQDGSYELLNTTVTETFVDTSGTIGESYFYRVLAAADNPDANSALSILQKGTFCLPSPVLTGENDAVTGNVQLQWEPIEGAIRYEVYRAEESEGTTELLGSTKQVTYTDKTGTRQERYYYQVVAVARDALASSAPSAELEKFVALPCPTITVGNHATNGRVKISWTAVEGAVGYKVYRATSKDGDYRHLTNSENTVCLDTDGSADKTYHYKVLALAENEAANSGLSASRSGTYRYPSKLTLAGETNSKGKPELEWNEVKDGVKYRLYRSLLPDKGFTLVANTREVEYTNSSALAGVGYYYRVKAMDKDGEVVKTSNTIQVLCPPSKSESFKTRYINAPKAWLYAAPTIESESIPVRYMDKIKLGEDVSATTKATWYRVDYKDQLYYMRIEPNSDVLTSQKRKFQYEGQTKYQQAVIDLALEISEKWKTTYARGQSDGVPNSKGVYGFNCSGLVKYVLDTAMHKTVPAYRLYASIDTLYETISIYNKGYPGEFLATNVKRKNMQPGDILFFTSQADGSDSDEIGHCGIYLGNNEFVHATSLWEDAVCIIPLAGSFEENLVAIRRYLPKTVTPANTRVQLKNTGTHRLYTERTRKSSVVTSVASGGTVTVLFTDNADWAWVRAEDGKKGFIMMENFK